MASQGVARGGLRRWAVGFLAIATAQIACPSLQPRAAELVGATAGELGVSPSGSASYSIPIAVPAGTTGLQPKITLQYDSLAGNGPAGMGWSIGGLSAIGRCPTSYNLDGTAAGSPGIDPVDYDANDKYCLNGQRLVPVSGTYGADGTEYRTTQDEFSRIVSYGAAGSGPQWFKIWRKSGEIMEFGNTADSRIEALGRSDVFVWAINKLSDTVGNYETFTYTEDTTNGGYRIARIDYTGNDAQGLAPYNHVEFIYAARGDVMRSWQAGSKMVLDQRLTNIKVYADSTLYRDYQLAYETTPPLSGRSRLVSVTECATDTATSSLDCFPATTFQWSQDGQAGLTTSILTGTQGIHSALEFFTVGASGDFNGDGLTDIYLFRADEDGRKYNGWPPFIPALPDRVWLTTSTGTFQEVVIPVADSLPTYNIVAASGDFNGDGLTDFYSYRAQQDGQKSGSSADFVAISNGNGTFTRVTLTTANSAVDSTKILASGDFNADGLMDLFLMRTDGGSYQIKTTGQLPYVLMGQPTGALQKVVINTAAGINIANYDNYAIPTTGDFNGDGLTDMYVFRSDKKLRKAAASTADHFWIAKWAPNGSTGTLTFQDVTLPAAQSVANGKGIGSSGDYNGDGLTDFYVFTMDAEGQGLGNLQDATWISKGDFTFEVVTGLSGGSQVPDEYRLAASGDFTGDGLTDHYLMRTQEGNPPQSDGNANDYIVKSLGDGHFQKVSLAGAPGIGGSGDYDLDIKVTGDFNGDGLLDLYLYYAEAHGRAKANANDRFFLSSWKFPDQLVGVTNGLGLSTKLAYKPLTDTTVYTKGTGSTYPVQEVIAPRYVVSEVRADNGIGAENSQTYKYEALRTHANDIGNLGFAKTKITDAAKNIVTESVYSQDWANDRQGMLTSSKTLAPAPYNVTLSEQTITWASASGTTVDGTPLKFRYSPSSTTVRKDLNGTLLGTVTETTAYDDGAGNYFANYGFPRQVTVATVDPGGSITYTKTTTNSYTHDAANWRLGRLTGASVLHQETGKPSITRTSSFTYDAGTGLITSETVEPGSPLFHTKTYGYNGFGAVTSLTETWGAENAASIRAP
ncbi:FG-GAP-like repeat-containing protein [Taklimakanibacter lacteus]|uniref:FG-GAP-like repeat-containing protein n=1 Tax=Taklimakanibacter lacteus TaxID=2268456 RepID=UPI0013C4B68F